MKKKSAYRFIYNPHAGEKRGLLRGDVTLEHVMALLEQYEVIIDPVPTKRAGHARELAVASVKAGYETVLVAGGDGTVSEVANGLVGTPVRMGILPMGTFMNVARMLSIPLELENAVRTIKMGRTCRIDVGVVEAMSGKTAKKPFYFLETVGVGLDAQIQKEFKRFEDQEPWAIVHMVKRFIDFYGLTTTLHTDEGTYRTKASLISIANGPMTGANLRLSPESLLNDHTLSIAIYTMSKRELLYSLLRQRLDPTKKPKRLRTIQTKSVTIESARPVPVHADATVFGETPATIRIRPSALSVICGYPAPQDPPSLQDATVISP